MLNLVHSYACTVGIRSTYEGLNCEFVNNALAKKRCLKNKLFNLSKCKGQLLSFYKNLDSFYGQKTNKLLRKSEIDLLGVIKRKAINKQGQVITDLKLFYRDLTEFQKKLIGYKRFINMNILENINSLKLRLKNVVADEYDSNKINLSGLNQWFTKKNVILDGIETHNNVLRDNIDFITKDIKGELVKHSSVISQLQINKFFSVSDHLKSKLETISNVIEKNKIKVLSLYQEKIKNEKNRYYKNKVIEIEKNVVSMILGYSDDFEPSCYQNMQLLSSKFRQIIKIKVYIKKCEVFFVHDLKKCEKLKKYSNGIKDYQERLYSLASIQLSNISSLEGVEIPSSDIANNELFELHDKLIRNQESKCLY